MTKPMIRVHNTEINEVIDREMTDAEYAQYQVDAAYFNAKAQAEAQAEANTTALLTRLGLTADEFKTLLKST
jgi:hypothetical protein